MKFFWKDSSPAEETSYKSCSDSQLLDYFKSNSWSRLNEAHRISVVQEIENRNALSQGREPAIVISQHDPTSYGGYCDALNRISIDVTEVSSYESLDTYIHESTHAYQAQCIKDGEGYDDHTLSMMQAESARDEHGCLYNYATESPEYDMQCNELDSNSKAAEFLMSQSERYGEDAEYREYIDRTASHFDRVNSSLDARKDLRTQLQNEQCCNAFVKGDLSEEQFNSLIGEINDSEYTDSAVRESHEVRESLTELNTQLQESYSGTEEQCSESSFDYAATDCSFESSEAEQSFDYAASHESSASYECCSADCSADNSASY